MRCDEAASCNDTLGSFTCTCHTGWNGTGLKGECDSVDECDGSNPEHTCDEHASCLELPGTFECGRRRNGFFTEGLCNAGWTGDGHTCDDINECTETSCLQEDPPCTVCPENGQCVNNDGSFLCNCDPGYKHAEGSERKCDNVDECTVGTHTCHGDAKCTDEQGSFSCACKDGFAGVNGTECADEDECLLGDACPNGQCFNTFGSFECNCLSGFDLALSGQCIDVRECEDPGRCHAGATCEELPGSFDCACNDGWIGNGTDCHNINECL